MASLKCGVGRNGCELFGCHNGSLTLKKVEILRACLITSQSGSWFFTNGLISEGEAKKAESRPSLSSRLPSVNALIAPPPGQCQRCKPIGSPLTLTSEDASLSVVRRREQRIF